MAWRTFQRRSHGPELQGDKLLGIHFNFDFVGEIFIKSIGNIFNIVNHKTSNDNGSFFSTPVKFLDLGCCITGVRQKIIHVAPIDEIWGKTVLIT